MRNPFEDLGNQGISGEDIAGAFTCQECYFTVTEAKYLEEQHVLSWICPEGHISKIEGFKIDG